LRKCVGFVIAEGI
jgi:hypothetical protein